MPSNFTGLTVTWFDETVNYVVTRDITNEVLAMPLFTEAMSGELNQAKIELSGAFGQFISNSVSGEQPIDSFDRIRIQVTDLAGNPYDRFFEVKPDWLPTQTKGEGTMLTLDLVGIEYHTQQIHFNRAFWFKDAFEVAREVGQGYETNRGTRQPNLTGHTTGYSQISKTGNGFPRHTVNHYEYGTHEDYVYNRWLDQIDKLGGSVDRGGVLDFFEVAFETPAFDEIEVALFSSGSRTNDFDSDASLPTIKKGDADINVGEQEGGLSAPSGSLVAVWGAQKEGSFPIGHSQYVSGLFQFQFRPQYDNAPTYQVFSRVLFDGKHYESLVNGNQGNTPPTGAIPPAFNVDAFWFQIDMSTEFGDTIEYSEWTANKAQHWINCGSNPMNVSSVSDGTFTLHRDAGVDDANNKFDSIAPGMFDCNIVINDNSTTDGKGFFRTWVDCRVGDGTLLQSGDSSLELCANTWAYSGNKLLFPRGFRALVWGSFTSGTLSGNDPNGQAYANSIVEFTESTAPGPTSGSYQFFVKYSPPLKNPDLEDMQVAVLEDGVVWFYDDASPIRWQIQQGSMAYDCFHIYDAGTLIQTDSFDPKPIEVDTAKYPEVSRDQAPFAKNVNSGVSGQWNTRGVFGPDYLIDYLSNKPKGFFYNVGAWFCFRFPFSPITEGGVFIGDVFGRGGPDSPTPSNNFPGLEPSTITTLNMDFLHDGNFGYNQLSSFDYGPLQSLAFAVRLKAETDDPGLPDADGIYNARVCMFDTFDNVMYADFEIPFIDRYFPIDLPISSFSIYRARKPAYFLISGQELNVDLVLPKELSVQNQFEWRNIKLMTIHLQYGYDQFGRYAPGAKGVLEDSNFNNTTYGKIVGLQFTMSLDDFHFTKPLLAISKGPFGTATDERALEPEFLERPYISTFDQLLNDADTHFELEQFKHEQYDIHSSGDNIFDLKVGDGFFFEDDFLTNREDDSTAPGVKKIKLVVKRMEFSITAPGSAVGGLTRRIIGSRRFQ